MSEAEYRELHILNKVKKYFPNRNVHFAGDKTLYDKLNDDTHLFFEYISTGFIQLPNKPSGYNRLISVSNRLISVSKRMSCVVCGAYQPNEKQCKLCHECMYDDDKWFRNTFLTKKIGIYAFESTSLKYKDELYCLINSINTTNLDQNTPITKHLLLCPSFAKTKNSPLLLAVKSTDVKLVELILDKLNNKGVQNALRTKDSFGNNIFHYLIGWPCYKLINFLVEWFKKNNLTNLLKDLLLDQNNDNIAPINMFINGQTNYKNISFESIRSELFGIKSKEIGFKSYLGQANDDLPFWQWRQKICGTNIISLLIFIIDNNKIDGILETQIQSLKEYKWYTQHSKIELT